MSNHNEDINRNFGTLFLMILFSLFILVLSDKAETYTSISPVSPYQAELVLINIPDRHNAVVFNAVSIPDLYKECLNALHNTGPDRFSIQYNLSDYNHSIALHFSNMQKTRLEIGPLLLWRLYLPVIPGKNDDSPVLS